MMRTRPACYEIEPCYIALAIARRQRTPRLAWWRRWWNALARRAHT